MNSYTSLLIARLCSERSFLESLSSMNTSALVVSDDLILRGDARCVLNELHIDCVCCGTLGFRKALTSGKFDAIVIDYPKTRESTEAIQLVRTGRINRYSIILALVTNSEAASAAQTAGANFTIQRSSSLRNHLERSLQSAYGLILRERRRYNRHPVNVSVDLLCHGRITTGRMVDISEGGACVECSFELAPQPIQLGFSLPGLNQRLRIEGVSTWTRGSQLGIHFTSFAEASQTALTEWLRKQIELPSSRN
jgi:hypothetical protein